MFARWEGAALGNGVVFVEALLDARPAGASTSVREIWAFIVVWEDELVTSITADQDVSRARAQAQRAASGG